jgi:3',5'-cyclic AMP phosphodiesterase CpdA
MRILHFSDVHVDFPVGSLPWSTWLSKRALGGLNHAARRRSHFLRAREKLGLLHSFALEQRIDLALCTGDYTILGTAPEIDSAFDAMKPFTQGPFQFATVPGNHDVYLEDSVRDGRFPLHFGPWMKSSPSRPGAWPFVQLPNDNVAIIGIESARPNPEPWRSSGRIPEVQLDALRALLQEDAMRSRFVIVMTHYAPRLWTGEPDTRSHGLDNASEFIDVLGLIERGCVLHGHVHRRYGVPLLPAKIQALCAGSTTQEGREGLWVIDVNGTEARATPGAFKEGRYILLESEAISLAPGLPA